VDAQSRILDVVDNFAALAFDVGPTLMAWLETERPDVYAAILELRSEDVIPPIESALARSLATLRAGVAVTAVTDALALLALATVLDVTPDLWASQNAAAVLWRGGSERDRATLAPLMAALGFAPGALAAPRGRG
jgi:hypothetical protein